MSPARIVMQPPSGTPVRNNPPAAAAAADQWVEVGPAVTLRPQGTALTRVAGLVRALAVSDDGQRIYCGGSGGGVWYSGDAGAHWLPLDFHSSVPDAAGDFVAADALAVGAIVVKWGTPATDVVYVGTGIHPPTGLASHVQTVRGVGFRMAVGPANAAATGTPDAAPWVLESPDLTGLAVFRLARDLVTDDVVWAATSRGLYKRPAAGGAPWQRIDAGFGNAEVSDVVVVAGIGGEPQRIYAATADGRIARSTDGTMWTAINLPASPAVRVSPAIPIERVTLAAGNVPGRAVVYALGTGPRLWRIDGDAAVSVEGIPAALFTNRGGEAMAIAVHPSTDAANQDVLVLGGGAFTFPAGQRHAALFTGKVTAAADGTWHFPNAPVVAPAAPAEWIGAGIHPDVHALAWVTGGAAGTHLWVGTAGGNFRSERDAVRGRFTARNNGLNTLESATLAHHRSSDTILLVGTRANGTARREDGETWRVTLAGRGGGVAIDGEDGRRMFAQVSGAQWQLSTDGGQTFVPLEFLSPPPAAGTPAGRNAWQTAQAEEQKATPALSRIGVATRDKARRLSQYAIGTDRVWYADDEALRAPPAGRTGWVTLPTGTDPYDPARAAPDRGQDRLDFGVLALHWGTVDRLYALTLRSVYLVERNNAGAWQPLQHLYDQAAVHRNWKGKVPSGQIPDDLVLQSLAVHDPTRGKGTLYVGTSGRGDEEHLWWFDGTDRWRPGDLGVDTPVYAVVVDPAHREVVYIGTDAGVWKGTGTFPAGGSPSWTWEHYSAGLPEAPCVDLAVYSPDSGGQQRLLRAALAGRGVWEVALDARQQGPEVYLRSSGRDSRRSAVPTGGPRDPFSPARAQVRLDASPDIRVWRTAAAPVPQARQLPLNVAGADEYDIWLLQSVLRAAGEDLAVTGAWSPQTQAALTHRQAALPPPIPGQPLNTTVWNAVIAGNALPFDSSPADQADLIAHLQDQPDRWPKGLGASVAAPDSNVRVYVTVHSRHWRSIQANRIAVALLRTRFEGRRGLWGTPPLPAGWAASLRADVAAPTGAWLAGTSWSYLDPANPIRRPPAPLTPGSPQVVVFDNLTLAPAGDMPWHKQGLLVLVVVHADDDPLNTLETDVVRLLRTDHHVAARSIRKEQLPARQITHLPGVDISRYPTNVRMDQAWRLSNIFWTGLYLDSPTLAAAAGEQVVPPQPPAGVPLGNVVNGHNRAGNNPPPGAPDAWMGAWGNLQPDWGVAPIYWGQQDPSNGNVLANGTWQGQGPFDLRQVIAEANGDDAAAQAAAAGIPRGAVIYLDWEISGAPAAAGRQYCKAFWRRLAEHGYRPGMYGHRQASAVFRQDCPGLFVWNVRLAPVNAAGIGPAGSWSVVDGQLLLDSAQVVTHMNDPDNLARQWLFDTQLPPLAAANPIATNFRPDLDIALVQDPAFPERRMLANEIRRGKVATTPSAANPSAVYAIRRGKPIRSTWAPGAAARDPGLDAGRLPYWWNPFAAPIALRTGPGGATTDWLLAVGSNEAESPGLWRVHALSRAPGGRWQLETIPDAGFPVDPLVSVMATTRSDQSIEAFVVNDDTRRIAVTRWDPARREWSAFEEVQSPVGPATTPVGKTSRPAAVSRGPGLLDLFWVGVDDIVRTSSSTAPGTWTPPVQLGTATLRAHLFANLVAVSRDPNRIDVLFIGRPSVPANQPWRLYDVWWSNADQWGVPPHEQVVGGAAVNLEPLASIAACSRAATRVDAFVVGDDGRLYTSAFTAPANAWSALQAIGGAAVGNGLASVDGASCEGNNIDVVGSGRDGNVYATRWDSTPAGYTALQRVAPLDVI